MGCSPSTPSPRLDEPDVKFGPPQPIKVNVGSSVRNRPVNDVTVIFIFGGPGSQKGLIIEELTNNFGFITISIETVIFTQFMNKNEQKNDPTTSDVYSVLKDDQNALRMDWLLNHVSSAIVKHSYSGQQRFIVDFIPTLSWMLRSECFHARSHRKELEAFERNHPIMFALYLNVSDEVQHAEIRTEESTKEGPEGPSSMKGMDEVDKGKYEKRIDQLKETTKPFVDYFNSSNRTTTMFIADSASSNVIRTVKNTFLELGFTIMKPPTPVLCFTCQTDFHEVDLDYYKLRKIYVQDLAKSSDTLETTMKNVHEEIQRQSRKGDNFLLIMPQPSFSQTRRQTSKKRVEAAVDGSGSDADGEASESEDNASGKQINFLEKMPEAYLDEFIVDRRHERQPSIRSRIAVTCITSTTTRVLIFFEPFNTQYARSIARAYRKAAGDPS